MAYQVDLEEARLLLGPVSKGTDRDLVLEVATRLGVGAALQAQPRALVLQQLVDGGG